MAGSGYCLVLGLHRVTKKTCDSCPCSEKSSPSFFALSEQWMLETLKNLTGFAQSYTQLSISIRLALLDPVRRVAWVSSDTKPSEHKFMRRRGMLAARASPDLC